MRTHSDTAPLPTLAPTPGVSSLDRRKQQPHGEFMTIGVIGIGKMGGTLARRWRENGHGVRVANSRGPEAVKPFADDIGADAADIYAAVDVADVVLLSIHLAS